MQTAPHPVRAHRSGVVAGALVVTLTLLASGVTGGQPAGAQPAGPRPPVGADSGDRPQPDPRLAAADRRAVTAARAQGHPVEVAERANARQKWLAEPDGSMQLEESAAPSRVPRTDGTWADLDPQLHSVGGLLRPAVSTTDLRFSTGGSGPFATMATDRGRLSLTWPGVLPTPTVTGAEAVYPDVLPGVDLRVRADEEGFSHVLVVKDHAAAQNPALATIRLGLSGSALSGRTTADGGLEFTAPDGTVAASGSEALMWDSRGGADATQPGDGSWHAVAAMSFEDGALVLRPDQALLTGTGAQYPVYIDPSYARADKRWAFANSANESNNGEVRVGRRPDTGAVYRSYFTYDVSALRGKHIFAAMFHSTVIHSWSCGNTPFSVYQVASAGSGRLAWSGPALGAKMGEASGHAHKPSGGAGCSNDPQPDLPVEVGGGMTTAVRTAARAGATQLAFALTALSGGSGESTQERWKKFRLADTKLTVDFNSPPTVPTSASTDGRGCTTGTDRPVLSTATPTLRAVVGDPDPETDLRATFEWQWYDTTASTPVWTALGTGQMNDLRPGATGSVRITSGLVQDGIYRWRARTVDPWTYNGSSGTDTSEPTGWCEFSVDLVGPGVGPGVSSTVYGADLNQVYGAVGRTAPFTFTASGVGDVVAYHYGWADPPTTQVAVAAGADATLNVTPPPPAPADPTAGGLLRLYVVSLDAAGHVSPLTVYAFNVGSATPETGRWNLDDATFTNSVGGGPAAVPSGDPTTGVDGRMQPGPGRPAPTAVAFDGVDDSALVDVPVLDTTTSFTVSVWARSDGDTGDFRSIVSGPANHSSAFLLGRSDTNRWRFAMPQTDAVDPVTVDTVSTSAIRTGVWTNLVAGYDAGTRKVYLYVDGVLEGSGDQPATFAASRLQIGRDLWNDSPTQENPWQGALSELRVWNRVLSPQEVTPLATDLVGRWTLDGDGTDATPYQRTATPTAGAAWVEDRDSQPYSAMLGDGATAAATTAGPALRSDQSFTVAAWARLDSTATWGEVLAQAGSVQDAIFLRFNVNTGAWDFLVPTADAGSPGWPTARSTAPAVVGQWTHLVGVYDASAGTLKLYVNGVLNGSASARMWASSGVFDIGRREFGGGNFFTGAIDDVRVYAGAMPAAQVANLYAG